jgi:hypothetical protein
MRLWSSASDKNRPLKKNWSHLLGITAESIEKTHGRWEKNRPNSVLSQWIIHRYPEQMFGPPNQISLLFWGYGFLFDLFGYHIREYHYESAICVSSSGFLRMDFLHQDHLPGLWIGRICEECHAPASHRHSGTTTPLKNAKRNSSISL